MFSLTEIRKPQALTALATALAKRIGETVTFESLGRELGLSKNTAERYTYLLELAGIVRVLTSYTGVLSNEIKRGKKVYFTDVGVRNALIGDFSPFSTRADAAALWENFFFMERVKLHDAARDRKRLFFWRAKGARPHTVDFLERKDGKLEAFVCRLSGDNAAADPVFAAGYPGVPVHVVTPQNCLPFLGITAAGPASGS